MANYKSTRDFLKNNSRLVRGRVLDYGAGRCKYRTLLSSKADEYLSFDLFKAEHINITGDIHSSGLPDQNFDTIVCTQVLEHSRNPFLVVGEIKRMLKPGGVAILTAPFMYPYHPDPEDNFRLSVYGLASFFTTTEFQIIKSGGYGGFFSLLSEIIKVKYVSSYKQQGCLKRKLFYYLNKLLFKLDNLLAPKTVYVNSYLAVKKLK